ncbi:MAG: phosphatase PAP2 family protein [Clostridiales bacterium]|jgi:undecaprenyl-diphosphatase|nr:phosphatase PAP2 family protein [Clostridiales bacterium]
MFEVLNGYEIGLLNGIQEVFGCGFLDTVMPYITKLGDSDILAIVCAAIMLCFKRTRAIGVAVAVALILELVVVNVALKPLIMRARPFVVNPDVALLIGRPGDYSFPSGHTASMFAFSVSVLCFNKKLGAAAVVIAALVAFSRLYLYVHYPSDVIAGMLIGIIIAIVSSKIARRIFKNSLSGA